MRQTGFILSALLVVTLLAFAPASSQAALPSIPSTGGAAGVTQYIPKDSSIVVSVNVAKLAEAGVFEAVHEMAGEDAFEALDAMGIDITKDLSQVMLGLVVNREDPEADPAAYIAFAGNLPTADTFVTMYTEEEGEAPESKTVAGKTVYTVDDEVDICFLPGVVLLVPLEGNGDISKMLGGVTGSITANVELAALMTDVDSGATIWGVASLPQELRDVMAEESEGAPFDVGALQTVIGSFDYADNVMLNVIMGFANAEAPTQFVDMVNNQVKPMGQMMADQMPALVKLLNAIETEADENKVTVSFNLGKDDFNAAIQDIFGMIFGAMMGGMEMEGEEADW